MRNLLLFLVVLIAVYYLRRLLSGDVRRDQASGLPPDHGAASSGSTTPREAEQVLPCAHCGLLVPASEGVETQGLFFCSAEHASAGPAAR